MVRPSGKQLLISVCCVRRAYRVMWHNCPGRCSLPEGMKKLSHKNRCKLACHAHVSTLFTGLKQRFIHTQVTRSPPIGIAKLCEVFMNYAPIDAVACIMLKRHFDTFVCCYQYWNKCLYQNYFFILVL